LKKRDNDSSRFKDFVFIRGSPEGFGLCEKNSAGQEQPRIQANKEPFAKVVSGNLLPHFGVFPSWIFDPWNHHASQSILKIHATRIAAILTQN